MRKKSISLVFYKKSFLLLQLIGFVGWEIMLASLKVALAVIAPKTYIKPGILAIPLSCKSQTEITIFATLSSLIPGTLSLDISPDCRYLYMHVLFIHNVKQLKTDIKLRLEARILEILR